MLEDTKKATDTFLAVTQTILNTLRILNDAGSGEYGDNDTGNINKALEQMLEKMLDQVYKGGPVDTGLFFSMHSSLYNYDSNFYENLDEDKLNGLRKSFYGLQKIKQAVNSINNAKTESRNLVHQEMTGIGGREKSELGEKLQMAADQFMTQLFEMEVSLTQQAAQLANSSKYLENQIDKAKTSQVFNILANVYMVLGIVASFFCPPLGLILGVMAAGVKLLGAGIAHSMSKEYQPELSAHKPQERKTDTGNLAVDVMNESGNLEDNITQQLNEGLLVKNKDGFYELDAKRIADIQKQLTKLQNIQRAMLALYKEEASNRRLVHMELTGIGGRETAEFVTASAEIDFQEAQFKFETAVFMLNELKMSKNIHKANDKQWEDALNTFWITLACQVIGYIVGELLSAAAQIGTEAGTQAGTQAAVETTSVTASEAGYIGWGVGGAIGGFVAAYLNNTVWGSDGVAYGDSSLPPYIAAMRKNNQQSTEGRLDQLEAEIYEDLLTNGICEAGGGNWALRGDYIARLRMALGRIANIKNAMASVGSAQADARNLVHAEMTGITGRRAGTLAQEINQAEFDGAMKAFDQLVNYLGERVEVKARAVQAQKAITDAEWKLGIDAALIALSFGVNTSTMYQMLTYAMGLANSVYDFIINLIRSNSDKGELENYDAARTARELKNENDPNSSLNKLDDMEAAVYGQISSDMIEELGGGRVGLNSGVATLLNHKMERIFNVKDAIAKIQAAESEARAEVHAAMTGLGGSVSNAATAFGVDRAVALENISSLLSTIQAMTGRMNQMNEASRQMWQSLVMVVVSSVMLYLAYNSTENNLAANEKGADYEKTDNELKKNVQDKDIAQHQAQVSDADIKVIDAKIEANQKSLKKMDAEHFELTENKLGMEKLQLAANLIDNMSHWLAGVIYDKAKGGRQSKAQQYNSQVNLSEGKGWGSQVSQAEERSVHSSINAGESELDKEALEIGSQENDEFLSGLWQEVLTVVNYIKTSIQSEAVHLYKQMDERSKASAAAAVPAINKEVNALRAMQNGEAITGANSIAKKLPAVEKALTKAEKQAKDAAAEPAPDKVKTKEQYDAAKKQHAKAAQDTEKLKKAVEHLGTSVADLKSPVAALRAKSKSPEVVAHVKAVEDQINAIDGRRLVLKAKADQMEKEGKVTETRLEDCRKKIALPPAQSAAAAPQKPQVFQAEQKQGPNRKVLLDSIDQLSEEITQSDKAVQTAKTEAEVKLANADRIVSKMDQENLKPPTLAQMKEALRDARAKLRQAQQEYSVAVQEGRAKAAECKAKGEEIGQQIRGIDEQIGELEAALAHEDCPEARAAIRRDIQALRIGKDELTAKLKAAEGEVAAAKENIVKARDKVKEAAGDVNKLLGRIASEESKAKAAAAVIKQAPAEPKPAAPATPAAPQQPQAENSRVDKTNPDGRNGGNKNGGNGGNGGNNGGNGGRQQQPSSAYALYQQEIAAAKAKAAEERADSSRLVYAA